MSAREYLLMVVMLGPIIALGVAYLAIGWAYVQLTSAERQKPDYERHPREPGS